LSDGLGILTIKMFISLIIMLGLIFSLYYFLKRFKLGPLSMGRNPMMRIIGTLNLAPKRGIALIEVCDQWLVIGIGVEDLTLISKVDRPAVNALPDTGAAPGGNAFHSILENIGLSRKSQEISETGQNDRT
jgi:flagellar biosynthetic protein FliO